MTCSADDKCSSAAQPRPRAASAIGKMTMTNIAEAAPGGFRLRRPTAATRPSSRRNNEALQWKIVDGVKVGHLIRRAVQARIRTGPRRRLLGLQRRHAGADHRGCRGRSPAHLRHQPSSRPTSVHWHGIFVPNGMDGVAGLTQRAIQPGETFKYEIRSSPVRHAHVPLAHRRNGCSRRWV